jgi:hypothetical protein
VERAAVAANVECGALDQRTQLGEREFAARDDALRKGIAEHRPGTIDDARGRVLFRRPGRQNDSGPRFTSDR